MPPVSVSDLAGAGGGESSAVVAARVLRAREVQAQRYKSIEKAGGFTLNCHASGEVLEEAVTLEDPAKTLLNQAAEQMKLSARGYHRMIRVARTIADLDGAPAMVGQKHVAEALSYRRFRPNA